ncbi:MAG: hypothetical protein KJO39_12625 [Bacteroidia bacterium]|nr:hypothetical protein [Bacteroidia bacterium]NNK55286.1 hypothetical protein [Flavobacteriaceae bacterium]NNM09471.1 hypothetical protein [Flavobacteriaceae bacterium]
MKKKSRKSFKRKKFPEEYKISDPQLAKNFHRPLKWLNRLLDALIEILDNHLREGVPITPGTEDIIPLLKEYKMRAIREGFLGYFPESDYIFSAYYRHLEALNRRLLKAKLLAHDRRACLAELVKARDRKQWIPNLFLDYMGIEFSTWYHGCYALDKVIERLEDAIDNETISQDDLIEKVVDILSEYNDLRGSTAGEDAWDSPGDVTDDIRDDFNNMKDRIRFLLEQVRSGDWDINNDEDKAKIKRILRELRVIKHRILRHLGDFGGKSILDWYKKLYEMDIHIDNAIDMWKDGKKLTDWDPELVEIYIRMAERAKIRFLRLFPLYLGMSVSFFYKELYLMDLHMDQAKAMMDANDIRDALRELRHVRIHKHKIERILEES